MVGNETQSIRNKTTFKFRSEYKARFCVVEGHRANIETRVMENEAVREKNL